jgi:hypothetical protein
MIFLLEKTIKKINFIFFSNETCSWNVFKSESYHTLVGSSMQKKKNGYYDDDINSW